MSFMTQGSIEAAEDGELEAFLLSLGATPEGIRAVEAAFGPDAPVTIVTAGMDEGLNELGYIVPGLGDAGDRLYGVV